MTETNETLSIICEELGDRLEMTALSPDAAADSIKVSTEFEL